MTISKYEQMGLAALLPGMQHMIDCMQAELDRMRSELASMQNGAEPAKRKYTPRAPALAKTASGWPTDPEERKREMARRVAKRRKSTPIETTRDKMVAAGKRSWEQLSPYKRKQKIAKMLESRRRNKAAREQPVVRLAS